MNENVARNLWGFGNAILWALALAAVVWTSLYLMSR